MSERDRVDRRFANWRAHTPAAVLVALGAGTVQGALWLAASGYIVYAGQDCVELTCLGAWLAEVFFIPFAILLLILLVRTGGLRSTARTLTLVLEVFYAIAALLFAASFVGDWSNTPADSHVFTAAFLLLAITLPIVVITGLVRSRSYFAAAKRNRPYRQLWKQFGLVLAAQAHGNGRIAEVAAGSIAEAKDLHVGDLIIAVNGVTVASSERLIFLLINAPRSQSRSLLVQDIMGVARTVIIERR